MDTFDLGLYPKRSWELHRPPQRKKRKAKNKQIRQNRSKGLKKLQCKGDLRDNIRPPDLDVTSDEEVQDPSAQKQFELLSFFLLFLLKENPMATPTAGANRNRWVKSQDPKKHAP